MSRERKNDEMSFEERRRNGEMICISCGQFSSITTCYHCGLILSGLHPAAKFIAKTAAIDAVRVIYRKLKKEHWLKVVDYIETEYPEVKDGT